MRAYTEEEKLQRNIYQTASSFVYTINKVYNKDKDYYTSTTWKMNHVGFGCHTYISATPYQQEYYRSRDTLYITVDANDVLRYCEHNGVSIESATKCLVSHEIFHVLLGHFSDKYKKHNKQLLNIAGDLEINQLLNLGPPGIQPEDYGFKPFRTTDYYYDELIKKFEEKIKITSDTSTDVNGEEQATADITSEGTPTNEDIKADTDELESVEESVEDNADINTTTTSSTDTSDEENSGRGTAPAIDESIDIIPEDREVNTTTAEIMENEVIDVDVNLKELSKLEAAAKKDLAKNEIYDIKGLDEIIRRIVNKEKTVKITPHDKISTYYKFNNRRKSDFILPGKKLTNTGLRKKLDSSLTVFIDVSGSTHGKVNINLMNVARKMYSLGATIVYYNSDIRSICEPDGRFFTEYANGGTDITSTLKEYLLTHQLERAYIFTDGQDDFRYMKDVCDKFTVYFIDSYNVYEKYTEKSNYLGRW